MPDSMPADHVRRAFAIREDQAEWLRTTAFVHRTSQAALFREAIEDLQRKHGPSNFYGWDSHSRR
jgi:hypothetical protein